MAHEDGFELIDKSELSSMPAHESAASVQATTTKHRNQEKSIGAARDGNTDVGSYLAVVLTHVSSLKAFAYQAAAIFASLACQKVCMAWQRLCDPDVVASMSHSSKTLLASAKSAAISIWFTAQSHAAGLTAFSDAALSRASARTDHIHGLIFVPPPATGAERAKEMRVEDIWSLLNLAKAWLCAVLELFVYECVLFVLFMQEMVKGLVRRVKSHKVAAS